MRPVPIDVIEAPDVSRFHRDYVRNKEPVVIRGALDAWPTWSPDYFAEHHGGTAIETYVMRDGQIVLDDASGFLLDRMSMAEYVRRASPDRYLRVPLSRLPRLARDIPHLPYAKRLGFRQNLWFAAADTVSALHFDLPNNLIAQLHGRKRFLLFRSRDRRALYPFPVRAATPHLSQVDPESPDLARFPRYARATPLAATLEPGDLLFIPRRVWHHARALTSCISVNTWWCDPRTYPVLLASDSYKRLRGLNI